MLRLDRTSSKKADEPPYLRIAALNAYNASLLVGALVLSFVLDASWIAICACAAETVWLLFAPESPILQRLWFDRVWEAEKKADRALWLAARTTSLALADQMRVRVLAEQRARIEGLAKENPTFAATLLMGELDKLDGLVEQFVDLGVSVAQRERHLATFDLLAMRRAWEAYRAQYEALVAGDSRHDVARKNLEVLKRRFERHDDLVRSVQTARGQMDLIESSFRLLADEIVTMGNPSELGRRLDELRIAVDAVRDATSDAEMGGDEDIAVEDARARVQ